MAHTQIVDLPPNDKAVITFASVLKNDILWWLFIFALMLTVFFGIDFLVKASLVNGNVVHLSEINQVFFNQRGYVYWILILVATMASRKSIWPISWIISIVVILFVLPNTSLTLANNIFPNSILASLIAIIGILSLERLTEVFWWRFIEKIRTPFINNWAIVAYVALIALSIFFNSHTVYTLFSKVYN